MAAPWFPGRLSRAALRTAATAAQQPRILPIKASTTCCQCMSTMSSAARARHPVAPARLPVLPRRGLQSSSKPAATAKVQSMADLMRRHTGTGPFSVVGIGLFVVTGIALFFYFDYEKARLQRKRIADENKAIGKPRVGGAFNLVDHDGNPFSQDDLRGRYSLVYFGFTRCPDICPDELDKMARTLDLVAEGAPRAAARDSVHKGLVPVFITCDPARDSPAALKTYLAEFHPRLIGLTGSYDDIKRVCKAYRVYFSTPEHVAPGKDYLVDHSIYFYVMDPNGDFIEALGRQHSPEEGAKIILRHMNDWKGEWRMD